MKKPLPLVAALHMVGLVALAGLVRADPPPKLDDVATHFTDDEGRSVTLGSYEGSVPVVVTTFFTSCPTRCPRTVSKLKALDAAYGRAGKDAQFVLITLDPDKDTVARLRAYKREAKLSDKNWHLLTGTKDQTHDIAVRLGVHPVYDDTHILHDIRTFLFDTHGKWLKTLVGWNYDDAEAIVP